MDPVDYPFDKQSNLVQYHISLISQTEQSLQDENDRCAKLDPRIAETRSSLSHISHEIQAIDVSMDQFTLNGVGSNEVRLSPTLNALELVP